MSGHVENHGMEDGVQPFVFNFADFERMDDAGLFLDRDGRVELIEGKVVHMASPAGEHTDVTSEIHGGLYVAVKALSERGLRVLSQGTVRIGDHSAPEPDVFVARHRKGRKYYEARDVVLVIEVAVTTLANDRDVKAPLYARGEIPEFWLVVPEDRSVRVYRQPCPDSHWGSVTTVTTGSVHPLFAPEIAIALSDVFAAV